MITSGEKQGLYREIWKDLGLAFRYRNKFNSRVKIGWNWQQGFFDVHVHMRVPDEVVCTSTIRYYMMSGKFKELWGDSVNIQVRKDGCRAWHVQFRRSREQI